MTNKIRLGSDGRPLLDDFTRIYNKSALIPYDHMTHVDKLFSLDPLHVGVMFAGQVAIGERTIKNLVAEFKSSEKLRKIQSTNYTLGGVTRAFLRFIWRSYKREFPDARTRPELELMIGGYDKKRQTPGVARIYVHENKVDDVDYNFGVYFGGQMKEIQRLVFGTDRRNIVNLAKRTADLLKKYHTLLTQQLEETGVSVELKKPEEFGEELFLFNNWNLDSMEASWGAFSEQNAIECVDFLVSIMIRAQQFSAEMPTVGGEVQVAVIKKNSGFTFVSRREWRHGDYSVEVKE